MSGCPICGDIYHGVLQCPNSQVGKVLGGKYNIQTFVAAGGMGAVYRAQHLMLTTEVAIKVLHPSFLVSENANPDQKQFAEQMVQRFIEEARKAARLKHDRIVRVEDLGTTPQGLPFIAMELLQGVTIAEILKAEGPLEPRRAIAYILQALDALSFAHTKGIIHRDIKPENLFVVQGSNDNEMVKILDFGLAKAITDGSLRLTKTGATMGTPYYMSPEQAVDPRTVDERSDVFSIGASLFEMLTGRPVLSVEGGSFLDALIAITNGNIQRNPQAFSTRIPDLVDRVVAKSLSHNPKYRYQSAQEFHDALRSTFNDLAPLSTSESTHIVKQPKTPLLFAIGVTAVITAAIAGITIVSSPPSAERHSESDAQAQTRKSDANHIPNKIAALEEAASKLVEDGKTAEAIKDLATAQELEGTPRLYYRIAVLYNELGKTEEALEYVQKYIRESPNGLSRADAFVLENKIQREQQTQELVRERLKAWNQELYYWEADYMYEVTTVKKRGTIFTLESYDYSVALGSFSFKCKILFRSGNPINLSDCVHTGRYQNYKDKPYLNGQHFSCNTRKVLLTCSESKKVSRCRGRAQVAGYNGCHDAALTLSRKLTKREMRLREALLEQPYPVR